MFDPATLTAGAKVRLACLAENLSALLHHTGRGAFRGRIGKGHDRRRNDRDRTCNLPDDLVEIAERIFRQVSPSECVRADYDAVVRLALQHLMEDLHSGRGPEVLEDIRREIAYRHWTNNVGHHPL